MKVLLLAAGLGTRLRPLTDKTPKCLVPICGKPLLGIWLDLLKDLPNVEFIINTHYLADQVQSFVNKHPLRNKITLIHEEKLLGTGGTLLKNKNLLNSGESFWVIHADNLAKFEPIDFLKAHENKPTDCIMTMMTFKTDSPSSCGIVEVNAKGVLTSFHEKVPNPPGDQANAAVYIFNSEIFELLESIQREYIDLSVEIIPALLNRVFTYKNETYLRDIGNPSSYNLAQKDFEKYK